MLAAWHRTGQSRVGDGDEEDDDDDGDGDDAGEESGRSGYIYIYLPSITQAKAVVF